MTDPPEDQSPRVGRGQKTRDRILAVAEELIARHGVAGFELKDVAARVGIRSPSIFAHFKGREDLAEAVARRVGQVIVDLFDVEGSDPEATLRRAIRSLVAHLAANPAHVRILLADLSQHREVDQLSGSAEHVRRAEQRVEALLAAGVQAGCFRKVEADAYMAFMLGGILSSLAWYGWDERGNLQGRVSLARIQRDAEDIALAFLCAPGDAGGGSRDDKP